MSKRNPNVSRRQPRLPKGPGISKQRKHRRLHSRDSDPARHVPIETLISGSTIDLTHTHPWYLRHLDSVIPAAQQLVSRQGKQYRVSDAVLASVWDYIGWGPESVRDTDIWLSRGFDPHNAMAAWLYQATCNMLSPRSEALRLTDDEIAAAWQRVGGFAVPGGSGGLFKADDGSEVEVYVSFSPDRAKIPMLRIAISGTGVTKLMRTAATLIPRSRWGSSQSDQSDREDADRFVKSLIPTLRRCLGIAELRRGNVSSRSGAVAAFLKEDGHTWREIAGSLCSRKHNSDRHGWIECEHHFAQLANNYWKRVNLEWKPA